ncbi:MAG: ACP S-malonyltransferase [Alphaproteobacteria bacterium]|nr:ACP S-malonyltransferase [Alphaproteobacteria bacterium]
MKKTAAIICPGRGTYNKDELGYLRRHHADKSAFIQTLDDFRKKNSQPLISILDAAETFSPQDHLRGDNASPLIYACAYADFLSIDQSKIDIVAVTGNSMGWYIALACAGALSPEGGMEVVNTMGTLMQERQTGGQVLYSFIDDNWREIPGKRQELLYLTNEIPDLYISIELGGMIVFAGTDEALKTLLTKLEPQGRFPLRLPGHGAYHTPIMEPIAAKGRALLSPDLFSAPAIPLIDGRGKIWSKYATDPAEIYAYTLDHQVTKTYDFTRAVQVTLKEFAPEILIIPGPGNTLGGAVAQSALFIDWHGIQAKEAFTTRQEKNPFLLSMGLEEQRRTVTI